MSDTLSDYVYNELIVVISHLAADPDPDNRMSPGERKAYIQGVRDACRAVMDRWGGT
jgi:hypothetical protein